MPCKQSASIDDMIDHVEAKQRKVRRGISFVQVQMTVGFKSERKSPQELLERAVCAGKMLPAHSI